MSSRIYPRIDSARDMRKKWDARRKQHPNDKTGKHPCRVCGEPGTHAVWVQVNWFRGEDEGPFDACMDHRNDAHGLLLGPASVFATGEQS